MQAPYRSSAGAQGAGGGRYHVDVLARLVPDHIGLLEGIFLFGLTVLAVLVGVFALYVVGQQFRNPGRSDRR
ncbi:MAG: hypothetical protein ACJ76A_00360 [Actinomycetota bacterium]|jgi:hypothetical protein